MISNHALVSACAPKKGMPEESDFTYNGGVDKVSSLLSPS